MNPELTSTLPARDTWWSVIKDAVRVPQDYTAVALFRRGRWKQRAV